MNSIFKFIAKKRLFIVLGIIIILILAGLLAWLYRANLFSGADTNYKPVSEQNARKVAENWLKINPTPMLNDAKDKKWQVQGIKKFKNKENQELAYIVDLKPQGYIIVPADENIEPILAFSTESNYSGSLEDENHLSLMLANDIPARIKNKDKLTQNYKEQTARRWGKLKKETLSAADIASTDSATITETVQTTGLTPIVNPLTTVKWGQGSFYTPSTGSVPIYNYYTPNNYWTGCVATAVAQVMDYYKYPPSAAFTGYVYVNGSGRFVYVDSTYDYSQMPDTLSATSPLPQIQQVARLLADVGAGITMSYSASSSSASNNRIPPALIEKFHYISAQYKSNIDADVWTALKSELNSGHPVPLMLSSFEAGHEVVADGWGTDGLSDFYHLNMGWSGESDGWYAVPGVCVNGKCWDLWGGFINNIRPAATTDTASPTVSLTAPAANAQLSDLAVLAATATDNAGVARVEFYAGNILIGNDTTSPYSFDWNTIKMANGTYFLSAKAYDAAANVGTSVQTTVTVNNPVAPPPPPPPTPPADTSAPIVSITSPTNGAVVTVKTSQTITATAADNISVSKVEFYVSNKLTCTDTSPPYTCTWKVPNAKNKTYTFITKAIDSAGNTGTSAAVSVTAR